MAKINYIDLFSGAGGLSLGLHNSGYSGIFAIEKNKDAFETLKHNLIDNKNHFHWPDWLEISEHDIDEILTTHKKNLENLQGTIDLIVGGPPCQGFSMAGKRNASDQRNTLVNSYLQFVDIVKPNYIFLENVHGFSVKFDKNGHSESFASIVQKKLKNLGYYTISKEVSINEYGVPQKRKRYILIGSRKDNVNNFFDRLAVNSVSFLENLGLNKTVTISEAISDLAYKNGILINDKSRFKFGKYGKIESAYQSYMRSGCSIPDSHRFANQSDNIVDMQKEIISLAMFGKRISPKNGLIKDLKRRGVTLLDPQGLSPTVTSHPDELVHYCEPRILTVREMARLQSFPDSYLFKGKFTTGGQLRKIDVPRYTQVANAIPPLFAEQIGLTLKEYING